MITKNHIIRTIKCILFLVVLNACESQEELVPYDLYRVKQGNHYSTHLLHELRFNHLTFDIIFDPSCVYTINASDQADINKLFGFSDCNDQHHENSARFGWRWYKDSLQVMAYVYNHAKVSSKFLAAVPLATPHRYTLSMDSEHYYFTIDGLVNKVSMKRTKNCDNGIYYLLYPYFGGNNTAPHDVDIYMKRIY
jgi:hypothetical protein